VEANPARPGEVGEGEMDMEEEIASNPGRFCGELIPCVILMWFSRFPAVWKK
jgi:hypothetical protein